MMKNYKTYILIDYTNDVYGFVNTATDINNFYKNLNINISSLPKDSENVLTTVFLVNLKTKEEVPVKFSSGNTLCV